MDEMQSQFEFIDALFRNFIESFSEHINRRHTKRIYSMTENFMNKNTSKQALKRKITLLRQELLNLEKMIERE